MLTPLENKNAVGFQYSHTLLESVVNHLRPVFAELAVLFNKPRGLFCPNEVRWVEYDE